VEALSVIFIGGHNMTFGTKMNAQKAFFAEFFTDFNIALQIKSPIL
jgi:hypothetical protein